MKMKSAYARVDGRKMELERELESAAADQEELESLRAQVKSIRTKYSQAQGFQMSLERDILEKDEEIEGLGKQVAKARKSFAQADGYRMKVEREIEDLSGKLKERPGLPAAEIEYLQEELQK